MTWTPEARARDQNSFDKANAGEITWAQHHRNQQAICRTLHIKSDNGWPGGECDVCHANDVRVFGFHFETSYASISANVCRKCGERLASVVDAKLEFIARKEIA